MESRPKITIKLSLTDRVVEKISWWALISLWALTLWGLLTLPDVIPIHFNGSGQVDGYGNKFVLIILPILATGLIMGMTALNKYPHLFNYPVSITAENARSQYTNATRMILYMKVAILLVFIILIAEIQLTATKKLGDSGSWFLPLDLILIFTPILFFGVKSFRMQKQSPFTP